MVFGLAKTIHTAWRTAEERPLEYMSCKTVFLYYDEKYSWLDALSLAYDKQLKGITMPPEYEEVAIEIYSVCLAVIFIHILTYSFIFMQIQRVT